MGLAGVAQVVRIHRHTQHLRKGKVCKETDEVVFAVTTLTPEQAGPERLLQLAREHWSIENGQHHRRDRTQREDSCTVRDTRTGRTLSLLRSLSIFLFEQQRKGKGAKASLPDLESHNHSHPWTLIHRFMDSPPL
jgi:predicted transposase YbfD/YdcC